jgi:hypothetical protein
VGMLLDLVCRLWVVLIPACQCSVRAVTQVHSACNDFNQKMYRPGPVVLTEFGGLHHINHKRKTLQRASSIEALLKRASTDAANLPAAYQASLHAKHIADDLRVQIKTIFENLRSCLDYMAHDIFEGKCLGAKKPSRLYFPIRQTAVEFKQAVTSDFPGLMTSAPALVSAVEAVQPYKDPWLGKFNKLNNHNKHQDLVEQTRTETRHVTVSRGGASASWGPGVTFGPGVSVVGVPIDPRTQMPVPNNVAETTVVTWVDFRFAEVDEPVLGFVEASVKNITNLFNALRPII